MARAALFLLNFLYCFVSLAQSDFYAEANKGFQELSDGNPVSAKQTLEQALKVLPGTLKPAHRGDFFNNLGVAYYQTGDYKKGIDAYALSLESYKKTGNDSLVAGALLNLGLAYKEIGAYRRATSEITQAARLSEKYGNRRELASAWNAIGNIERETGNYKKALDYHLRALSIRKSIKYEKGIADSYNNIGMVYFDWKKYNQAETCFLEALNRKKTLNNQSNTVNTLSALGRLYVAMREPEKALTYLNDAYKMRREAGNSAKAASSMYYLGTYYESISDRSRALELFKQAEEMARFSKDYFLLANVLKSEIGLTKTSGKTALLLEKYQELVKTRELAAKDANRKEMTRLEIEYDVERKEREIEIGRRQARLDRIRIENEGLRNQQLIIWIIGLSLLTSTVSVFLYQIRRRKRHIELQNYELEEQKNEITHLHQELSHRTKNYFGLLSGILKSDKSQVTNPETEKILEENIRRLEAMSLVQRYLLDDSSRRHKEVRLDAYLSNLIELVVLNLFPRGNNLALTYEIDPVYLDYDIAMRLAIALNELMCNSIEHGLTRSGKPELNISVKQAGNQLELIVKDNGPGVTKEQMYTQNIKGQALITKLLQKVGGTIHYHNNEGCTAIINIEI